MPKLQPAFEKMSTITAEKSALRSHLAARPPYHYGELLWAFLSLPEVGRAETLLLFFGVKREPDTRFVISALLARGKRVALPRCLPGRQMEARRISGLSQLKPGTYGIPEPDTVCPIIPRDEIDLILVPGLCCDRAGYRLGHGGGYYDRYLAGFRGLTAFLCPPPFLQEHVPHDVRDVPMELILTGPGREIRPRGGAYCSAPCGGRKSSCSAK